MLNYSDLSKGQKRCIDAYIKHKPELATQPTITNQEVQKLFWALHDERANGGPVIGYPIWLSKHNTVSRAVFAFPSPQLDVTKVAGSVVSANSKAKAKLQKIIDDSEKVVIDEDEFAAELRANGIAA